ncbi:MAG: acetyl-CoA carboxylase carboxyltransferase subunit alpha [Alphaproteobacteria bacterium]
MQTFLDFEKPVADLEGKLAELRQVSDGDEINIADEIQRVQAKLDRQLRQIYEKLTPWQKVQVARHPNRPHFGDYVSRLIDEFTPLAGDRAFGEDRAIIGGPGRFRGMPVMVIGQEKGNDTEGRVRHNFGMARPEGYRKARRLVEMASRFGLPIITLVDTAGAYPGLDAEVRGQAEAIARSIDACLSARVPIVSVILGEGGSGGAIALASGDRVLMLEHAVYSVISPEGCASILWRSADAAQDAAAALKLTAQDLLEIKIIDAIVAEPMGGAHRAADRAIAAVGEALSAALSELSETDGGQLRARRREKFLAMGSLAGA